MHIRKHTFHQYHGALEAACLREFFTNILYVNPFTETLYVRGFRQHLFFTGNRIAAYRSSLFFVFYRNFSDFV